ncbi:MAG: hypothetical protein LBS94_05670 [Prevotellaceae bacterium]|jgi:glycosidase|nr:hypothetical protein [Prevotellaceae bacterium]
MKNLFAVAAAASLLACGCGSHPEPITALASPAHVGEADSVVLLDDYFLPTARIDSVHIDRCSFHFDRAKRSVTIHRMDDTQHPLRLMDAWVEGKQYAILLKSRNLFSFTLELPDKGYKNVQVKGEFNGWNVYAGQMQLSNGRWSFRSSASRGEYQYCLVADSKEMLDPSNSAVVSNNMGGFNSLLVLGATTMQPPVLTTQKSDGYSVSFSVQNGFQQLVALWENQRLEPEAQAATALASSSPLPQELELTIPAEASDRPRSYLRVWASNEAGISNDLLIPLHHGKVLSRPSQLTRHDWLAQIIYSLMVDRFCDGDTTNNAPLNSPDVLPQVDFMGGDLAGITQKIDEGFFDSLGVSAIWISPVMQNPHTAWGLWPNPTTKFSGYHGYWPTLLRKIDGRFGTDAQLRKLIAEAHRRNINVLLDHVAHHVHIEHPLVKAHPDWLTPLNLPDGSLNTERWDDQRLTTWFDTHLPTLDLSVHRVADAISDSAMYWLNTYHIDGFRHDASKHVDLLFWRMLTQKIKTQIDRNIYQIGETVGSPEVTASYLGSGLLDAQFDFTLYDAAFAAFATNGSLRQLASVLRQSLSLYGSHNLMGNITGSHDKGRFLSYAGGALNPNEDNKIAGWTRRVEVGDSAAYSKLALMHAFIFSIPGLPCIYYGDELGMAGGGDPDSRRMMRFGHYNRREQALLRTVSRLAHLRRELLPLTHGDTHLLYADDHALALARTYFGQVSVTVINSSAARQTIRFVMPEGYGQAQLKPSFGAATTSQSASPSMVSVTLGAYGFEMMHN